MPPDPTKQQERKSNSNSLNADKTTPKGQLTRNSPAESPILLWREIPMAWGTTIDSLTPEINLFQYAIESKCLTLKDKTLYLILDN